MSAEKAEQLVLPLWDAHVPGSCSDEGAVADIGGGKSFCIPWDRWTNCREVGHCVMESAGDAGLIVQDV